MQRKCLTDVLEALATNSNNVAETISTNITAAQQHHDTSLKLKSEAMTAKRYMSLPWTNTLNTRKQAFWNYHRAKRTAETFENLLSMEPPQMPRKFLPRVIPNEPEDELQIRRDLAVEKFKNEINMQKKRMEKYQEKFSKLDAEMVTHITTKYGNDLYDILIKEWEIDCTKQEEISVKRFNNKEEWFLNNSESEYRNSRNNDDRRQKQRFNNNSESEYRNSRNNDERRQQQKEIRRGNQNKAQQDNTDKKGSIRSNSQTSENGRSSKRSRSNSRTRNFNNMNKRNFRNHNHYNNRRPYIPRFQRRNQDGRQTWKNEERFEIAQITPKRTVRMNENDEINVEVIPETQLSQIPANNENDTNNQNNHFLYHSQGATQGFRQ